MLVALFHFRFMTASLLAQCRTTLFYRYSAVCLDWPIRSTGKQGHIHGSHHPWASWTCTTRRITRSLPLPWGQPIEDSATATKRLCSNLQQTFVVRLKKAEMNFCLCKYTYVHLTYIQFYTYVYLGSGNTDTHIQYVKYISYLYDYDICIYIV